MTQPQIETIREALQWYRDEAAALNRHLHAKQDSATLASVTVFSLDGGVRATQALSLLDELQHGEAVVPMNDRAAAILYREARQAEKDIEPSYVVTWLERLAAEIQALE